MAMRVLWIAAAAAAWAAFAWVADGQWGLVVLALAHAGDGWRRERRVTHRPPWQRPSNSGFAAAAILGAVTVAILVGYRPDWLVLAGLVAATAVRWVRA